MATKTFELTGVGSVTLVKRAGSRNLRLTITPSGVRVTMPRWTPFSAGQAFARQHADWITAELAKQSAPALANGQRIGKLHTVAFEQAVAGQSAASRVTGTRIVIKLQTHEAIEDTAVQERAQKAVVRALKREAERLLPPRLASLAAKHGKAYTGVTVKQLKRRWGSCDSHRFITLNLFLMELPWEYIDYVLLHELAHTVEMNHGEQFWKVLSTMQPRARDLARTLRNHQPTVGTWRS